MKEYEVEKFARWRDETEHVLPLLMKRPLLVVTSSSGLVPGDQGPTDTVSTTHTEHKLIFHVTTWIFNALFYVLY